MSVVTIANMALRRNGAERINALTDNTPRAILMNETADVVRRLAIESGLWTFARKRVRLSTVVEVPAFEYSYAFQLPSDCIRPIYEYNDSEYKVEGRQILSNESYLELVYLKDITDDSQFTPAFIKAYAILWAIETSYFLNQSEEKIKAMRDELEDILSDARFYDSTSSSQDEPDISTLLNSRY